MDSRKLTLAVMLDQGLAKKTPGTKEKKGNCYANWTDICGNQILSLSKRIARKERREKENCKKTDWELEQDRNRIISGQRANTRGR